MQDGIAGTQLLVTRGAPAALVHDRLDQGSTPARQRFRWTNTLCQGCPVHGRMVSSILASCH